MVTYGELKMESETKKSFCVSMREFRCTFEFGCAFKFGYNNCEIIL